MGKTQLRCELDERYTAASTHRSSRMMRKTAAFPYFVHFSSRVGYFLAATIQGCATAAIYQNPEEKKQRRKKIDEAV